MMIPLQLAPDAFVRAATFLHQARALERTLFAFHFENASAAAALAELARFQNPDGGFQGLEADMGFEISTVGSTCRALHLFHELQADATHPAVARALDYLLATFDSACGVWPIIPPHDNSQPHAPWWHYTNDFSTKWGGYIDNPRPDVLAELHFFACTQTAALREHVTMLTLKRLQAPEDHLEMHGLMCYLSLYKAPELSPTLKAALKERLPRWIDHAAERNPAKWSGYGLRPLDVAPSAESPWRAQLADAVETNLDYLIRNQTVEGCWDPHWNWGDSFPEAWPSAKRKWQAVLTLANLRTLRSYGRIAS